MKSPVYFAPVRARLPHQNKLHKIQALFDQAGFKNLIKPNDLVAIKVHFGERGSDSYPSPVLVRAIVDKVKACGGKPFITDTGTLYSGSRYNAVDHLQTAIEHGFDYAVVGAPLIIADGLCGGTYRKVPIQKKHIDAVIMAGDIYDAACMIVVSHFKGHELAGFGGAIKNLAMGCVNREGKRVQHCVHQYVHEETCVGCARCISVCPEKAIHMKKGKASIEREKCIGCGQCMTVCTEHAIDIDWQTDVPQFMERMTEYAYGVSLQKKDAIGYINFLTNIVPDCDCCPWSDAPVVPDIGFLASLDPVAIDKACYDLVCDQRGHQESHLKHNFEKGTDKFTGVWPHTQCLHQITYGTSIGLGNSSYTLNEINL